MGDIILGGCIVILLVLFMMSPVWVHFVIEEKRRNSVKVGNIYLKYRDSKNPFEDVQYIFKVIDKRDGYIQYEEFRSTDDALNNVAWYHNGERKIDSLSLKYMVNWWEDFKCWLDVDEK